MDSPDIPFIKNAPPDALALTDDYRDTPCSYKELKFEAGKWRDRLSATQKQLIFLFIENNISSVQALLGALWSGHAVALLDSTLSTEARTTLIKTYAPEKIIASDPIAIKGYPTTYRGALKILESPNHGTGSSIHPDLSLLLSTSGSTGSPKFVRLTMDNLSHNAAAIAEVLHIKDADIASAHLQLHYSYGLSVLTSFLNSHAKIALTDLNFTSREFWEMIVDRQVTHLPGVPFHYQIMGRLGFERLKLDNVTVLTQAGGKMDATLKAKAHDFMDSKGGAFYVMYGQTEASPRITTLSHEVFPANPESVGTALPGGKIKISNPEGQQVENGVEGEVLYQGPNVMMGYADNRADLAKGDLNKGLLQTGDIGYLNANNMLFITGRNKRIGKIYGWRVNLDEVESFIAENVENAVLQIEDSLKICIPAGRDYDKDLLLERLDDRFSLPRRIYQFIDIPEIPVSARNKTDYNQLKIDISSV